ncbi:MAG: hypothetical protein ABJC74_00585 [Gemmatimonadota bacterium]
MLFLTALLLVTPVDSSLVLKKCGAPSIPVGIIFSGGTVSFSLSAAGVPDSSSIRILQVGNGSAEGLRSALTRQLPSCRFKSVRQHPEGRAEARVAFDADLLKIHDLKWADPADTDAVALGTERPETDEVVEFLADSLEERPANNCQVLIPRDAVTTKYKGPPRDTKTTVTEWARPRPEPSPSGGTLLMRYIVSAEGRVDPDEIQIDATPGPTQSATARRIVSACRWVPGRIHGFPVAVRIAQRQKF